MACERDTGIYIQIICYGGVNKMTNLVEFDCIVSNNDNVEMAKLARMEEFGSAIPKIIVSCYEIHMTMIRTVHHESRLLSQPCTHLLLHLKLS